MEEGDDQVLAYVSLITSLVGFVVMPVTLSVIAAITGWIQLRRIREEPEVYGGRTLAMIGMWIGIIRGSLYLLVMIMLILVYLFFFGFIFVILGSF